jgi:hypothetical protein
MLSGRCRGISTHGNLAVLRREVPMIAIPKDDPMRKLVVALVLAMAVLGGTGVVSVITAPSAYVEPGGGRSGP